MHKGQPCGLIIATTTSIGTRQKLHQQEIRFIEDQHKSSSPTRRLPGRPRCITLSLELGFPLPKVASRRAARSFAESAESARQSAQWCTVHCRAQAAWRGFHARRSVEQRKAQGLVSSFNVTSPRSSFRKDRMVEAAKSLQRGAWHLATPKTRRLVSLTCMHALVCKNTRKKDSGR